MRRYLYKSLQRNILRILVSTGVFYIQTTNMQYTRLCLVSYLKRAPIRPKDLSSQPSGLFSTQPSFEHATSFGDSPKFCVHAKCNINAPDFN